jgi:hypothetical protein
MLDKLYRSFLRSFLVKSKGGGRSSNRRQFRPSLTQLEDRTVLSTVDLTSVAAGNVYYQHVTEFAYGVSVDWS